MLTKINRIKKKKDFETIFKNGSNFKAPFLVFKIFKNDLGYSRFGFVVSQKVSKKAVVRNKVRRRITEIIKSNFDQIKKGIDVVTICLPGIEKKDFPELKEIVIKNFLKSKILNV
jgi:ribonuclease P protein component